MDCWQLSMCVCVLCVCLCVLSCVCVYMYVWWRSCTSVGVWVCVGVCEACTEESIEVLSNGLQNNWAVKLTLVLEQQTLFEVAFYRFD